MSTVNTPSKIQRDFSAWFIAEKEKGLKDIKFFCGDVSQATIDSFIDESNAIDRAMLNKQHSPFPDSF